MRGNRARRGRRMPRRRPVVPFRAPGEGEADGAVRRRAWTRALALAERGWGRVSPEPAGGRRRAVAPTARSLGEGWHEGPGTAHAEVDGAARGRATARRGATRRLHARALRPVRPDPPVHARADRCRGRARRGRGRPTRTSARTRPACAELRAAGHRGRRPGSREAEARRLNAAFERHVRTGPALRRTEVRGVARRQDRRRRRLVEVDHVAEARADAQRLRAWADADRGRVADRARRRPRAHRARRRAATDARPPLRVLVDTRRPRRRGGPRSSTRPRPTLVATTDRCADGRVADVGGEPAPRCAVLPRGRGGRRRRSAPSSITWASATCRGCSSRAGRRSRGRSSATTSSTAWSCTSRRSSSAASAAPGIARRERVRAGRRRARARVRAGRPRRPRSEGGGRCSPGSLRSAARSASLEGRRLVVRVPRRHARQPASARRRGERRVPHGGRARRTTASASTSRPRRSPARPGRAPPGRPREPRAAGDPRGAAGWAPRPGPRGRRRRGRRRRPRRRGRRAARASGSPGPLAALRRSRRGRSPSTA